MNEKLEALRALIKKLRSKEGCPWDREQTPESMSVYLIEEAYELAEAIEAGNNAEICDELGDVLFHIFFIAGLFEETGDFNIFDVAEKNTGKMKKRHPHVFEQKKLETADQVISQWNEIKKMEKPANKKKSILDSVPSGLPAVMKAYKLSEKAASVGFDWENISQVMDKAVEEWHEFKTAVNNKNLSLAGSELGDILFTLVNISRFLGIHPESALSGTNKKFINRFQYLENEIKKSGKTVEAASMDEMETLWDRSKKHESGQ